MFPSKWQIYKTTSSAWESMLKTCSGATISIDMEQYIFKPDNIGQEFLTILKRKNREEVKIRLLLDMVGSYDFYVSSMPEDLRKEGIEVRFFNIISPWRLHNISWFFRDHKKLLVVDKKIGFTGGVGVGDHMREWRDTMGKTEDSTVKEMTDSFEEIWQNCHFRDWFRRIKKYKAYSKAEFVTNAPYSKKRFLYQSLVEAFRQAKTLIYITNPYFIPDRRLVRILRLAVKRGVLVKIILPEKTDVPIVNVAAQSYFNLLLRSGIRIFKYQPVVIHTKSTVVDNEWATFGSFNLDSLSFFYNYEANAVTVDPKCVAEISQHFSDDLKETREILLKDWRNRPIIEKIKEFLVIPIRGFL